MRIFVLIQLVGVLLIVSCEPSPSALKDGTWRGVIGLQNQALPFQFEIKTDSAGNKIGFLRNASERIKLPEIEQFGDSVSIVLHIFDAQLRVKNHGDSLTGYYIKNFVDDYKIPFTAHYGQDFRFTDVNSGDQPDFSGKYNVTITNEGNDRPAVGIFEQHQNKVTGTFLIPTGDYRFLEGNVVDGKMYLSTFDGNHAYLFTASFVGDSLVGEFWSGKGYHATWTGIPDENAELPEGENLTYLKEGYESIEFRFPDSHGDSIELSDSQFQDKVVIVQILGTWCPNCMDETLFLKKWLEKNRDRGVAIVGLAYESKADFDYGSKRVAKMKDRLGIGYPILIAGTSDKEEASKTLPMLNQVIAFPTMIFIGRDGKVKHIHTGFSGPGTGIYYERFQEQFDELMNELLAENPPS